jgi:hypothetical protein
VLTNREWATLFWIAVILVVVLLRPSGRAGLGQIAKASLVKPILIIHGLYLAWIVLVVAVARALGLWGIDLAKDTAIWAITVGLPILFGSVRDATTPGYFRRKARQTVGLGVVVGFYLNLVVFPLVVELILQPLLGLIVLAVALTKTKKELARVRPFYDRLQAIIGLVIFAAAALWLITNFRTLDAQQLSLSFLLPVWLTLGVLPLIYVFSILFSYQEALLRLRWHSEGRRSAWRARLGLVLGFRLNLRDLGAPGQGYQWGLAHSTGLRDGLRIIRKFRRSLREAEAAERGRLARLKEFAGVAGTDEEGRRLDRREFSETREALDWLATCQMGWHHNQGGRYRPELLKIFEPDFARKGLPADHGIHLVVSRSGQAWYAWRRTITGWCFAIGASKAPPDQWHYDGPEPPKGFPGQDPSWGPRPLEQTINWEPS